MQRSTPRSNTPARFLASVFVVPEGAARFLTLMFVPGDAGQPAVYLLVMTEEMVDELVADLESAEAGELSPPLYTLMQKLKEQKIRATRGQSTDRQSSAEASHKTYIVPMNEEMLDLLLRDLRSAEAEDLSGPLVLLRERLGEQKSRRQEFQNRGHGQEPEPPRRRRRSHP